MPTIDEVEDYEFRLRVEVEELGEEVEDDNNNDNHNGDGDDDNNADGQQQDVAPDRDGTVQGRCKICFDGQACMALLPCGHVVMCPPCSECIMLDMQ